MKGNLYSLGLQENANDFEISRYPGMLWCKGSFSFPTQHPQVLRRGMAPLTQQRYFC